MIRHLCFISLCCFLGLPSLFAKEEVKSKSLAWLGYLKLPKPMLKAQEKVKHTRPLLWSAWKEDEGGKIDWIPRHKGYVNVLGQSLKVLPKGPDPKTLSRRQRHQLKP